MALKIKVKEEVKVKDKIFAWKPWLGKLKHFFTVKVIPPQR